MRGRTWKNIDRERAERIREFLIESGAEPIETKAPFEVWRYKCGNCYITFYTSGTMYATPFNGKSEKKLISKIEEIVGHIYAPPTKDWCVGIDETGKGEIFGYLHVVGVVFHSSLFERLEKIVGNTDTKRRHGFEFWQQIFGELHTLMNDKFFFVEERVSPSDIDEFNINELLNVTYMRVLKRIFSNRIEEKNARIVIDDYGVSEEFKDFAQRLQNRGAEVIIATKSEDKYLETRLAAIIAKWLQVKTLEEIRENPKYQIDGRSIGTGNSNEDSTIEWLQKWHKSGKEWPWFVRKSYRTVYKMDEKLSKPRKAKILKRGET